MTNPGQGTRRGLEPASLLVLVLSVLSAACDEPKPASRGTPAAAPGDTGAASTAANAGTEILKATAAAPSPESEEPERAPDGSLPSDFIVDDLVDVAPAGPASASAVGIVLITKADEVKLARLGRLTRNASPEQAPVAELDVEASALAPLARGPAVVGGRAYWISRDRLVRAPLTGGAIEVLASDARRYTRVVAARPAQSAPAAVAYLATRAKDPTALHAKLWIEGQDALPLSPDGSGASSVALAATESGWLALVLEGRTGMTPLHARAIQFGQGEPRLASDVVIWVGGSAQPLSEVHAIGEGDHGWAFLAMERDVTHFGLAQLLVESRPKTGSAVTWRTYLNGMDPAPMAAERVCGRPLLLHVRPSSELPHAPQELCASHIEGGVLGPAVIVARGRAFSDVSIAALPGGALVSHVADRRTWATTLRCRSQ